jgi:WD40 repeat protein/serine/threonine protein kinase
MPKQGLERIKAIFVEAVEKNGDERAAFLHQACGDDAELLAEVQAFLSASERAGDFLESPTADASAAPRPAEREGAGSVIGQYKLLELIGEGGFGSVFMAEQERPVRRKVALKIIKLGMDTKQVIARFEAERQALAMMDHPNIAKVFEAGATETGRPYFVMELVRGVPITQYCDSEKLATDQRARLFIQVCQAIQHAHQKGVIHRDIKPNNVLVTMRDDKPVPKIIDFGIAKATSGQRLTDKTLFTEFRQFLGTPAYMSPEQAQMNELDVDTRSDIYSLGVLFYELLTGTTPFDPVQLRSAAYEEIRRIIREEEPPTPSARISSRSATLPFIAQNRRVEPIKLIQGIRGELDWIVMKAMEKDRSRRYETANALALDIERHLNNEPILARPGSATYWFRKWVARNKLVFTAAAIVLAVLILGICVSTWMAVRASRARNAAQAAEATETTLREQAEAALLASERSQALALVDQADALRTAGAWEEARQRSEEIYDKFIAAKLPTFEADLCLWTQYSLSPPPLMTYHEPDAVNCVAICPDGRTALSGNNDGMVRVRDLPTGRLLRIFRGHTQTLHALTISPDGRIAASAGDDKKIILWDIASGSELRECLGHSDKVFGLSFSPDGRELLSGSRDKTLKLWDVASGRELRTFTGHTEKVDAVAFSPDGLMALSGSGDLTMKLWEVATGRVLRTFEDDYATVRYVGFTPDGRTALSCSSDQLIKSWDIATGRELHTFAGHRAQVAWFAVNPNGRTLVSASTDHTVKLWDIATGREIRTFTGHSDFVPSVAMTPDGRMAMSASADKTCKLWDLTDGREERPIGPDEPGMAMALRDGRMALSYNWHANSRLWDLATGRELSQSPIPTWNFGLGVDGRTVLTNDTNQSGNRFQELDFTTGNLLRTIFVDPAPILSWDMSHGRTVVTGDIAHMLRFWDFATGRELHSALMQNGNIWTLAVSPDERTVLVGSTDGTVSQWDMATGLELHAYPIHKTNVYCITFSPDGRTVLSGSYDSDLALWDLDTGTVIRRFQGHSADVTSDVFMQDGRVAITGSRDHTVRFWDIATGRLIRTFTAPDNSVHAINLNRDDRTVLTGGREGRIRLWDFGRVQTYRDMQPKVDAAEKILQDNPNDPAALLTLAQWWAFRGVFDWAADLFEQARANGATVSNLELGRCYWNLNRYADAKREFTAALATSTDPEDQFYLNLCIRAISTASTQPASTIPSSARN